MIACGKPVERAVSHSKDGIHQIMRNKGRVNSGAAPLISIERFELGIQDCPRVNEVCGVCQAEKLRSVGVDGIIEISPNDDVVL